MKKCPFCAEEIQDEAIKCKHCGEMLGGKKREALLPKPGEYILVNDEKKGRWVKLKVTKVTETEIITSDCAGKSKVNLSGLGSEWKYLQQHSEEQKSVPITTEAHSYNSLSTVTSVAKKTVGCFGFAFISYGMFFLGLLLSLTGILSIIGIPLMLMAIVGFFSSPFGFLMKYRKCPHCGKTVQLGIGKLGKNCPVCNAWVSPSNKINNENSR